jgi:hypothetical protein
VLEKYYQTFLSNLFISILFITGNNKKTLPLDRYLRIPPTFGVRNQKVKRRDGFLFCDLHTKNKQIMTYGVRVFFVILCFSFVYPHVHEDHNHHVEPIKVYRTPRNPDSLVVFPLNQVSTSERE